MRRGLMVSTLGLLAVAGVLAAGGPAPGPATAKLPKVGEPSRITLHYNNAPAEAVFKDLFGQIGREYITYNNDLNGMQAVTIDADNEPYCQVLGKLEDMLNFTTNLRRTGKVNISHNNSRNGVRCLSGPCMLIASNVRHVANLTSRDYADDCTINVILQMEPNLAAVTYSGRVRPDVAVDELGNSLVPAAAAMVPSNPLPGLPIGMGSGLQGVEAVTKAVRMDFESSFQVVLAPPRNAGYKIAQVKGTAHLKVIDKATVIDIPAEEFKTKHNYEFQGASIAVGAISTSDTNGSGGTTYRVTLDIRHANLTDEEWNKVNDLLDATTVSITDEKEFPFFSNGGGGGGGRGSINRSISYSFQQSEGVGTADYKAGPPVRCRIVLPEVLKDVPVPFEFKNLPLP